MKFETIQRRAAAATLAVGLALLLTGCFLSPGKFASTLDLRRDGAFSFSYKGEIYLLGLSQLATIASEAEKADDFVATTCYDDNDFSERDCTDDELDQQRKDWDATKQARKEEDERNSKAMAAMFGGVDPSDPEAAQEIATKLGRQKGWNSVVYKGKGLYEVDFSIASRLGHDFTFPVLEGFLVSNSFVIADLRADNSVRINAPGFATQNDTATPGTGFLQMASLFGGKPGEESELSQIPPMDGTFTITTDGEVLANNTDEGARPATNGKVLTWKVTRRTTVAPTALIQLAK